MKNEFCPFGCRSCRLLALVECEIREWGGGVKRVNENVPKYMFIFDMEMKLFGCENNSILFGCHPLKSRICIILTSSSPFYRKCFPISPNMLIIPLFYDSKNLISSPCSSDHLFNQFMASMKMWLLAQISLYFKYKIAQQFTLIIFCC